MGKWIETQLGSLIVEEKKSTIQVQDASNFGDYPFFTSGDNVLTHSEYLVDGEKIFLATGGKANIKFYNRKAAYSADTYVISSEKTNTQYLYYFLLHQIEFINSNLFTGSGLKHLRKKDFKKLFLKIPESKSEQTRIAQILSTADKAIAQTEALIAKYQRIKTGLMHDLLTRGIDEHGRIRSKATHRFVVKNGIEVPEEWEVLEIGEITEHVGSGITPKGGSNVYGHEGILLIRSQNVLVGEFNLDDVAFITPEINQRMLRSELQDLDVLLNITGASIGRSHFVPINFPKSNVNQHVCALRIKNKSVGKSLFVSSFLNSYEGQKQIKRLLGASNREGLNYQQIREIKIPIPKLDDDTEYQNIYFVLSSINKKMETLKTNWKKLHSLKTGLMQDLLSGRVRVKVPENENEKEQQNV